jgi:hypothetical protein
VVGGKISYGNVAGELGGFGGISLDSRTMNHGGMGSDSISGEGTLKISGECITSGEVIR